jgi:hypothetical protein
MEEQKRYADFVQSLRNQGITGPEYGRRDNRVEQGESLTRAATEESSRQIMVEMLKACHVPLLTIMGNDDYLPSDKVELAILTP